MASPNIDLDGLKLNIEINKNNKQWVARIDGASDKYGLDRDFISPYGTGTETITMTEGDIIEVAWNSHSGKPKGRDYYVVHNDLLDRIVRGRGGTLHKDELDLSPVYDMMRND